jgi:hypothetical protein
LCGGNIEYFWKTQFCLETRLKNLTLKKEFGYDADAVFAMLLQEGFCLDVIFVFLNTISKLLLVAEVSIGS